MRIAFIVFDGLTLLDLVGVYDPITRLRSLNYLPDLSWQVCGLTNTVHDSFGLQLGCDVVMPDLSNYDAIIVPGGHGTRKLVDDSEFVDWLRTARNTDLKISICTGSLLLGAAGMLKGRRATTHFSEYESLATYCAVEKTELVHDGDVISAGAVAASLNLGLYLCELWAGSDAAKHVQGKMNYMPSSPFPGIP